MGVELTWPDWKSRTYPLGQKHIWHLQTEGEGVEPPRQLRSTVFKTVAIANWLDLPLAPAEGFEPSVVSLTGRCLTSLATPEFKSQDGRI